MLTATTGISKQVTSLNIAWKVSVFGVILVPIFPTFFLIQTEYEEIVECGKNADQNNSEYRHFLRSENSTDNSLKPENRSL